MADEMTTQRGLMENSADAYLLREMIGIADARLKELEFGGPTGIAHWQKSVERLVRRNDHSDRDWRTYASTVELRIRELRKGSYSLGFLES